MGDEKGMRENVEHERCCLFKWGGQGRPHKKISILYIIYLYGYRNIT